MAWIKMRTDLSTDPAVIRMASTLNADDDLIVGKLHRLWAWADAHTTDGVADGVSEKWVDKFLGMAGFARAMQDAGWLEVEVDRIVFPRFDIHNGESAKKRDTNTERQRLSRIERDKRATEARPEKRREEKKREEEEKDKGATTPKPASPPDPLKATIRWTVQGWIGILDEDKDGWKAAYPACDIDRQLAAMDSWLRANPAKKKSNWPRFIVNWLTRSQDQGGDIRSNGNGRQGNNGHGGASGSNAGGAGNRPTAAKAQAAREFAEPSLTLPIHRFGSGGGGTSGAVSSG